MKWKHPRENILWYCAKCGVFGFTRTEVVVVGNETHCLTCEELDRAECPEFTVTLRRTRVEESQFTIRADDPETAEANALALSAAFPDRWKPVEEPPSWITDLACDGLSLTDRIVPV
jgi:hypothetical protein